MLTYQLQRRRFHAHGVEKYPNLAEVEFVFAPAEAFGADHAHGRTATRGVEAKGFFDGHNGRFTIKSVKGLDPMGCETSGGTLKFKFAGNSLFARWECQSRQELADTIHSLHCLLPVFFNVKLLEAPTVNLVRGKVGDTPFVWVLDDIRFAVEPTTTKEREAHLVAAIAAYFGVQRAEDMRFVAAAAYFYKACRLLAAGNGPWEFMAEAVLNLSKCLEILFLAKTEEAGSRDKVRGGLSKLGLDPEVIERDFIPILILRNSFDVGHGRLQLHDFEDLQLIYRYLANAEQTFRGLLRSIEARIATGESILPAYTPSEGYDKPMQGVIERLKAAEKAQRQQQQQLESGGAA